jgi:hypothetical protein
MASVNGLGNCHVECLGNGLIDGLVDSIGNCLVEVLINSLWNGLGGLGDTLVELDHVIHIGDGGEDLEGLMTKTLLGIFSQLAF